MLYLPSWRCEIPLCLRSSLKLTKLSALRALLPERGINSEQL